MEITNFKLIDFLNQSPELIEDYVVKLRYLKPIATKQEVYHMTLKQVEMIKENIDSGNDVDLIEIVSEVQNCTKEEVLDFDIISFFGLINSIRKQLEIIIDAEERALTPSEVNIKWELVQGSEKMAKFGIYNTLEALSGGDALKYKEYMKMSYSEIFTILYMRKTAYELQKQMNEIKDK